MDNVGGNLYTDKMAEVERVKVHLQLVLAFTISSSCPIIPVMPKNIASSSTPGTKKQNITQANIITKPIQKQIYR